MGVLFYWSYVNQGVKTKSFNLQPLRNSQNITIIFLLQYKNKCATKHGCAEYRLLLFTKITLMVFSFFFMISSKNSISHNSTPLRCIHWIKRFKWNIYFLIPLGWHMIIKWYKDKVYQSWLRYFVLFE